MRVCIARRSLLEASADKVHEEHVRTPKGHRQVLAARPSFLALAVCHASRTAFLICNDFRAL